MSYAYASLILERGAPSHRVLSEQLKSAVKPGVLIAQFSPQLGLASNEAVVLVRGAAAADVLPIGAPIVSRNLHTLTPTIRPLADAQLRPGGIYVHRWFTIDAPALDEFVSLSGQAWPEFERLFDAQIFGLFTADETEADKSAGARRLLLLTRYGNHDVWEKSRDPTTNAMQTFFKRQLLTRHTIARSSLLVE